jgi:hypothetical protein
MYVSYGHHIPESPENISIPQCYVTIEYSLFYLSIFDRDMKFILTVFEIKPEQPSLIGWYILEYVKNNLSTIIP